MVLPPRLSKTFRTHLVLALFLTCSLVTQVIANVKSVQTYKHVSDLLSQGVTSSILVWETFVGDSKQLEYAVHGGKYLTDEEHYPIYVCRAIIDGIYTSGHTEKRQQRTLCLVSMHSEVKSHHAFDILINKGQGAKLIWMSWTKFTPYIPTGAVSCGGQLTEAFFVARHKTKLYQETNGAVQHGPDYNLGWLDPHNRLGKIVVSEGNSEKEYEDGEILVEIEPVRYELREIKIDKWRTDIKVNQTYLGSAVLSNTDDLPRLVETVISFTYDKVQIWGVHDGVARGLPTKVYEVGQPVNEIRWGLKDSDKVVDVKTVSTTLKPGTALNVTLKGNYTTLDAPYKATLVAYYADNDDSISRKISANVQKYYMQDIKFEFSPVYWLENGTLLPTTTTTTTTTTTEPTTTSTREPEPVVPPLIHVADSARSSNDGGHNDASVAESKKNPNDIEDMQAGNALNGDASPVTNTGGDSLKLTNVEQNPANLAKDSANSRQQQSLVTLLGCSLMTSLIFFLTSVTSLN
ncbi:unnamed protein product [Hermetia illucens]|uniref:Protein unzipped n=1 Tax=Hermetia illucens TaxID=343691 RepID=A0A7R8V093_HERIL|nr:protein unzipped [Hermetia illucens]XP_037915387.1 protein unzipped [Hermetia illucens]CAD7089199.1 unnamed protein product [Hermetia illucens]